MAISSNQVTVGNDVAVEIIPNDIDGCSGTIKNIGAYKVYIGRAGVTASNGYELSPNEVIQIEIGVDERIFGICKTNQSTISYMLTKNQ